MPFLQRVDIERGRDYGNLSGAGQVLSLAECGRVRRDGAPLLLFTDWRQLPLATEALWCEGFT